MSRPDSHVSSLCCSALSSPLATARTSICSTEDIGDDTARGHKGKIMATIEVSELFAPMEARINARLDAIAANMDQRCGALEAKVGVLAGNAAGEAAGFQEHLQVLQEQMEQTTASLQAYLLKETSKLSELSGAVCGASDKQATLQGNIDDVWRQLKGDRQTLQTNIDDLWQQLKADRQDSVAKYRKLSDTVELRLRSLLNKVDRSCSDLSGMLSDDITPAHKDLTDPTASVGDLSSITDSRAVLPCVAEGTTEEGDAVAEEQQAQAVLPSLLGSRSASQQTLRGSRFQVQGAGMQSPKMSTRSPSPTFKQPGDSASQGTATTMKAAGPSATAVRNQQTIQQLTAPGAQGPVTRMTSVPYEVVKQGQIPRMTSDSSRAAGSYGLRRQANTPFSRSYQSLPQGGTTMQGLQSPVLGNR